MIQAYWNLHRKMWSIRDPKTRRVTGHANELYLVDCTFHVSEAGRRRVLATGRKNVHAYVQGRSCPLSEFELFVEGRWMQRFHYNPRAHTHFFMPHPDKWGGQHVAAARCVVLTEHGEGFLLDPTPLVSTHPS